MLSLLIAHLAPPSPRDLWTAWSLHPLIVVSIVTAGFLHSRGWNRLHSRDAGGRRRLTFIIGLLAIAVAVLSPLDALSTSLASAHMTQHVLLVLVAPALLAMSRPLHSLVRGVPAPLGHVLSSWVAGIGPLLRAFRHPLTAWMMHAVAIWFWHARVPYEAALQSEAVHILQHASFFLTALLFWSVVVRADRSETPGWGMGLLMVFATTTQTTLLAALMTFARTPWYRPYVGTTDQWGIDPLADQQLAAVIMWIPSGLLYLAAGIALVSTWMKRAAAEQTAVDRAAGRG